MSRALVPLAQGCEELEAVTIIDLLRRAEVDVTTASLDAHTVVASRGTRLVPDTDLDVALTREYDLIALPGGLPGADHLANDERLMSRIQSMDADGRWVCAICAAPAALARAGVLKGKRATAYPGVLEAMNLSDVTITGAPVEVDGNVITGRGPGTAMDFALALVEALRGPDVRKAVEEKLVRPSARE
ncbi:MAG TPA: DJ-1/PfpI family protein [Candidatus Hydrogenedentes bacterium]|nr:DJ-1/PfpI family protein [Candidatus Hydrogenedentota bacterium]HPG70207.1 DJ-1/PfpI family protein [Candidatus Hydrogenedentota bacterium]